MSYPKPKPGALREAFRDHGVKYETTSHTNPGRNAWSDGLRAATVHHTAGKNSLRHLQSFRWGGCNALIQHGGYNGPKNDGVAVILAWGSAWHSGTGGPWKGVAGKDSAHLVSWGIEIESLGTKKDMTDAQIETTARMLAALVDLGMPIEHIHRHEDWTDGSGPVGGYPLETNGRKIDTNDRWYSTEFWVKKTGLYLQRAWDGVVPDVVAVLKAEADPTLANKASHRLACRLADMGFYQGRPLPLYEQGYPRKAVKRLQAAHGWEQDGEYTQGVHRAAFGQ
jgi:hypothetical protein